MTPNSAHSSHTARRPRTPAYEPAPSVGSTSRSGSGADGQERGGPNGAEPWIRSPSRTRGS